MDLDLLERRQTVQSWRDKLILDMWGIVNHVGIEAKHAVEAKLAEAGIVATVWDPASFARERVDAVMREKIPDQLEKLFKKAAKQLRAIDPQYTALAAALIESLRMIEFPSPACDEPDTTRAIAPQEPELGPTSRFAAMLAAISNQRLVKSATIWGSWAVSMVGEASESASQKLQSGVGLHDRLRRSAQDYIETGWMAPTGSPPALMGQLIAVVESVGNEARSMAI